MDYPTLLDMGFTLDTEAKAAAEQIAQAQGLANNGGYVVHDVYTKGDCVVTIEQNQAPEDMGDGMSAMVTHPVVATANSPKGRCFFNPEDADVTKAVLEQLT